MCRKVHCGAIAFMFIERSRCVSRNTNDATRIVNYLRHISVLHRVQTKRVIIVICELL